VEDENKRSRHQVILPPQTVKKLDRIAQEYATSRSQAITIAVRQFNLTERMREGEPQQDPK
jgi:metal-responsive CopG/Arc/MetJ family transcriptional regulator